MMIRQNLHVHCSWDDGQNTIEEMIAAAKEAGLTSLGISVHTPVPYSSVGCPENKLKHFLDKMKALKETHNTESFQLYAGAEWDVFSPMSDKDMVRGDGVIIPGLESFDYVIGSVHALGVLRQNIPQALLEQFGKYDYFAIDENIKDVKYIVNFRFGGKIEKTVEHYFDQYQLVAENKHARIIGHFDLIKKFCKDYPYVDRDYHVINPDAQTYQAAARKAIDLLIEAGKIFEVNTSALDKNQEESTAYPSLTLLEYICQRHGRVTVSSDAHRAKDIAREFDAAERLLKKAGFQEIWVLEGKDFVAQPL